jgi:iron(III) transport system ATP-binding protein
MSRVALSQIEKQYDGFTAIHPLDLEIGEGEFVTLLGPSGCGKTTLLRMVAGLELPSGGRIEVGDRVFNDVRDQVYLPPEKRDVGMVFQSYAVWPHMTVARNIDYPLRVKKVPRDQREQRLRDAIELVRLGGQEGKWPHQLSGGQQQRVALARGLIMRPRVLLLDEPLSNLDAKLRKSMRTEIREIQRALKMTMLYVTHDREEAEAISDRMALIFEGRLAQIGSPEEICQAPASERVRAFFDAD